MKISKEKLMQIIKEELRLDEQEPPVSDDAEIAKTKAEFSKRLLELSKKVRNLTGLDTKEMQALNGLIIDLLELSAEKSAGPMLVRVQQKISQMTGAKQ
tara:strand:+ start:49 stop:345 length:297 start_codon:yes stop_codon:yes gene_type:complete